MIALACMVPVIFMSIYKMFFSPWDGENANAPYGFFVSVSAVGIMLALAIPSVIRLSREKL